MQTELAGVRGGIIALSRHQGSLLRGGPGRSEPLADPDSSILLGR
jgi:hypothetical protein